MGFCDSVAGVAINGWCSGSDPSAAHQGLHRGAKSWAELGLHQIVKLFGLMFQELQPTLAFKFAMEMAPVCAE